MMVAAESESTSRKNVTGKLPTPNKKITSRRQELQHIHNFPNSTLRSSGQRSCSVHSLAGTGQTQLVKEQSWEHRPSSTLAMWRHVSIFTVLTQDFGRNTKEVNRSEPLRISDCEHGDIPRVVRVEYLPPAKCLYPSIIPSSS